MVSFGQLVVLTLIHFFYFSICILFKFFSIGVIWRQLQLALFFKSCFSSFILFFSIFCLCAVFTSFPFFLLSNSSCVFLLSQTHGPFFVNLKLGNINKNCVTFESGCWINSMTLIFFLHDLSCFHVSFNQEWSPLPFLLWQV